MATLFVPLIKRSVSTTFKVVYGKLNCWRKIHSRGPYKNGENFVLSQNVLRKYFLAKFFVPLIKRSVSTNFKAGFGKLNFWQKIHSRNPYKNGKNFVLSQNVLRKYFWAKFFFPRIKRSVSTNFKAGFGKLNFWQKIHSRRPYKNGENFVLSQNVLRKYFLAKFFVPLIKRSVSTNFKAGFGKLNFLTENPQPRTLQKWWKLCTISKCAKKIFFGKIICSTHQKKCFYKFLGWFWKIKFLTENPQPRTLQKCRKFCTISKCAKKIIFGKILCSTHQKKCFYKLLGSFRKIEFLTENPQPRTLQKWWKFCIISKCAKKIFFGNIICSTHQKKLFYKLSGIFRKIDFWRKIHSRVPYKNGENFVLSQNVLRKYFSAKLFVPLIKRSVSTIFKAVFGKLNFWQKIHSRGPYKNGENFVLSQNVLRKYFLATLFVPLIKRSVSTTLKVVYGKLNCWRKIHSRGPYKNGENFVLSQNVLRKYFLAKFFVPLIKRSVSTNL